jgi:allantoin racemase
VRFLLINPNTTQAVTDRLVKSARAVASRGTRITGMTAQKGPSIVRGRADNAVAARSCVALGKRHGGKYDAVLLGISLDSGLRALRRQLDVPVLGMNESGVLAASVLAPRYGVLTFGRHMIPLYREIIREQGMASRLAGLAAIDLPATAVFDDLDNVEKQTLDKCKALARNGAGAILLAGAAYAGMRAGLQKSVRVPLLDGMQCAVILAEGLVRLARK